MPSEPDGDAGRYPVFVDDTGRRRRWIRGVGWLAGALAASYIGLFVLSVVSSPGLLPLTVPGVGRLLPNAGAPDIHVPGHGRQHVSTVVATSTPAPAPSGSGTGSAGAPSTPASGAATAKPTPAPRSSSHPTAKPTAVPSAVPTATPTAHGSPTARPTSKGTGKPTAQPTSSHGHGPSAHPHSGRP